MVALGISSSAMAGDPLFVSYDETRNMLSIDFVGSGLPSAGYNAKECFLFDQLVLTDEKDMRDFETFEEIEAYLGSQRTGSPQVCLSFYDPFGKVVRGPILLQVSQLPSSGRICIEGIVKAVFPGDLLKISFLTWYGQEQAWREWAIGNDEKFSGDLILENIQIVPGFETYLGIRGD